MAKDKKKEEEIKKCAQEINDKLVEKAQTEDQKKYLKLVDDISKRLNEKTKDGVEALFGNFIPKAVVAPALGLYAEQIMGKIVGDIIECYHGLKEKDLWPEKSPANGE